MVGRPHEGVSTGAVTVQLDRDCRSHRFFRVLIGLAIPGLFLVGCPKAPYVSLPAYLPAPTAWEPPPGSGVAVRVQRAWESLQAGDVDTAERIAESLQVNYPQWATPLALRGWVALARSDTLTAAQYFQEALRIAPQHVGALTGMMWIHRTRQDWVSALTYAERLEAVWAHPSDFAHEAELIRRRAVEAMVEQARVARRQGDVAQATHWYRQAAARNLTDARLQVEAGDWFRSLGQVQEALPYYQWAYQSDPDDMQALQRLAEALIETRQWLQAKPLLERLVRAEPSQRRWTELLQTAELEIQRSAVYNEYQQIERAPYVTRGQVAALLYLEIPRIAQEPLSGRPPIILDLEDHWARTFIHKVAAMGLIPLFDNHTFQPDRVVQRGEFAFILYNVLRYFDRHTLVQVPPALTIPDVSPLHRYYVPIRYAVTLGLLLLEPDGSFRPGQNVNGPQALRAIQALGNLLR
ncbi:MAG: S-layer homology domain-containing protein [Acidobacteria bacterium]|nr:S-layer homology domain-containing protein [Acidobacteriota bacterium]MDW7984664.1 S-layer homology domain-containing protein [Acidobacteriota bacterium]